MFLQLYFTGMHGEKCSNSKADIWAGNVTMMKALIGLGKINESTREVICSATYDAIFNDGHNDFYYVAIAS